MVVSPTLSRLNRYGLICCFAPSGTSGRNGECCCTRWPTKRVLKRRGGLDHYEVRAFWSGCHITLALLAHALETPVLWEARVLKKEEFNLHTTTSLQEFRFHRGQCFPAVPEVRRLLWRLFWQWIPLPIYVSIGFIKTATSAPPSFTQLTTPPSTCHQLSTTVVPTPGRPVSHFSRSVLATGSSRRFALNLYLSFCRTGVKPAPSFIEALATSGLVQRDIFWGTSSGL